MMTRTKLPKVVLDGPSARLDQIGGGMNPSPAIVGNPDMRRTTHAVMGYEFELIENDADFHPDTFE